MWGPPTSNMDWCEENYSVVSFIAEFFNTISSLPVSTFALHGLYHVMRNGHGALYALLFFCIAVVGGGSIAFHGTLTWQGQAADEIPMIWASVVALYSSLTLRRSRLLDVPLVIVLFLLVIFATWVYFAYGFLFFITTYICCVAGTVCMSIVHCRDDTSGISVTTTRMAYRAIGTYVGGFVLLWIPEVVACGNRLLTNHDPGFVGRLYLHAWFHVTSAFGAYFIAVFFTAARQEWLFNHRRKNEARVTIQSSSSIGTFYVPLPHVVVVSESL